MGESFSARAAMATKLAKQREEIVRYVKRKLKMFEMISLVDFNITKSESIHEQGNLVPVRDVLQVTLTISGTAVGDDIEELLDEEATAERGVKLPIKPDTASVTGK